MKKKNLKVYGNFLVLSVVLSWVFSDVIQKMDPQTFVNNAELIGNIALFTSFFFYTMIIVTIQALIHNVQILELNQSRLRRTALDERRRIHDDNE